MTRRAAGSVGLALLLSGLGMLVVAAAAAAGGALVSAPQADARAQALLARARAAVGGADRLAVVDRLTIETTDTPAAGRNAPLHPPAGGAAAPASESSRETAPPGPPSLALTRTYKLFLPQRFQSIIHGRVTHTLDGDSFWMEPVPDPNVGETAERSTRANFLMVSVAFLLTPPDERATTIRALGRMRVQDLDGEVLEFKPRVGPPLRLMLALPSAMPVAVISTVRDAATGKQADASWRMQDYRAVDGVKFPFRLVRVREPYPPTITVVQDLKVNPSLTARDFRKGR
jgi:hypothetical protein